MTRTLPKLTMRSKWNEVALWVRVKLGLPDTTPAKLLSAIIVALPCWAFPGPYIAALFIFRHPERDVWLIPLLTFPLWGAASLATWFSVSDTLKSR